MSRVCCVSSFQRAAATPRMTFCSSANCGCVGGNTASMWYLPSCFPVAGSIFASLPMYGFVSDTRSRRTLLSRMVFCTTGSVISYLHVFGFEHRSSSPAAHARARRTSVPWAHLSPGGASRRAVSRTVFAPRCAWYRSVGHLSSNDCLHWRAQLQLPVRCGVDRAWAAIVVALQVLLIPGLRLRVLLAPLVTHVRDAAIASAASEHRHQQQQRDDDQETRPLAHISDSSSFTGSKPWIFTASPLCASGTSRSCGSLCVTRLASGA